MGRPAYEPTKADFDLAYEGGVKDLPDRQIAKLIGISHTTFSAHKQAFIDHIKRGRDDGKYDRLERVQNVLIKKCEGFFVEEETTEQRGTLKDGKFVGESKVLKKKVKKYIQPSDTAIFFYLVNKYPDLYRSINQAQNSGEDDKGLILAAIQKMKDGKEEKPVPDETTPEMPMGESNEE